MTVRWLVVAGIMTAGAAFADPVTEDVKDASITAQVETQFLLSDQLSPFNINTTTADRIVTLSGSVRDQSQKDLAADLADDVDGVMEVINAITVVPSHAGAQDKRGWREVLQDKSTSAIVRTRLLYHQEFKGLRISIKTISGVVTLSGVVATELQKSNIGIVTTETQGVDEVVNQLTVRPKDEADAVQNAGRQLSDEWIEKRVETAIALNRHLSLRKVGVEVDDGICILTGTVDSGPEKVLAGSMAENIQGVRNVQNDLAVLNDEIDTLGAIEPLVAQDSQPEPASGAPAAASEVTSIPLESPQAPPRNP